MAGVAACCCTIFGGCAESVLCLLCGCFLPSSWLLLLLQVWNSVDQHSRRSYTSVIHGKYSHEETIATASFADTYVIVRDLAEAQMVRQAGQ